MQKRSLNNKGFGLLGILLVIVVIAAAGGAGAYVYHKNHKTKTTASSSSSTGTKSGSTGGSTTGDPYAGWKTYTDATYHYSFRYPVDWTIASGTGGASLLNNAKTVQVVYSDPFVRDSNLYSFTTTYIKKLTTANEDVAVIGGYNYSPGAGLAGDFSPSYNVVDSALLAKYPLTVGKTSQFPNNPEFTNGGSTSIGSMLSRPAITINSAADTENWLNSPDAKTSLLILESLRYQQ